MSLVRVQYRPYYFLLCFYLSASDNEPIFDELFEVAEIANFSNDEQDIYEATLKAYRDFQNVVNAAIQEAEEKATKKGWEQGVEKGRAEGA